MNMLTNYQKQARREERLMWGLFAMYGVLTLATIAFWAAVIYIALHFVLKMW